MPNLGRSGFTAGDIIITDSSNVVSHCGIVGEKDKVAHAKTTGMQYDGVWSWPIKCRVYRPLNLLPNMAARIELVAKRFVESGTSNADYGKARAFFGWTGSSTYGSDAKVRVATYRERLALKGNHVIAKNVFCSEMVVLVYQVACLDDNARHFIKLDAKHTYPKDLRAYLEENKAYWDYIGDLE